MSSVSLPLLRDGTSGTTASGAGLRRLLPRRGGGGAFVLLLCSVVLLTVIVSTRSSSEESPHVLQMDYWRDKSDDRMSESETTTATPYPKASAEPRKHLVFADTDEGRWDRASQPMSPEVGLEQRLRAWERAPREEQANWVTKNLETCPQHKYGPAANRQQHDQSDLIWHALNSSVISSLRDEAIHYLRWCQQSGKLNEEHQGQGRGLVFTAGNVDTFHRVLVTLKIIRNHLQSPLPAEIWSFPGEVPDEATLQELSDIGATLRVVEEAVKDAKRTKNYHIKATAIVRSRFREVLYLDSDNIPAASIAALLDPDTPAPTSNATSISQDTPSALTGIWESKAYQRHGAIFWVDFWKTSADNPVWSIIGVPCRDEWEQEAGVILVDKSRVLDAMLLAEYWQDSERYKFYLRTISDGDKDTFRYAMLALRRRWGLPGRFVGVAALPRDTLTGYCGLSMLQHDHVGRPLFVHANLLKQVPSGVGPGFAWGRTRQVHISPNELQLGPEAPLSVREPFPLEDFGVDADMLANAQNDGRAIKDAPPAVRRRAVLESGIRPGFHGGWNSALCIDVHWEDPRTEDEIMSAKRAAAGESFDGNWDDVDVSYTVSSDGVEIKFENPLEVVQWSQDGRLRDFEAQFFANGGKLNAVGF